MPSLALPCSTNILNDMKNSDGGRKKERATDKHTQQQQQCRVIEMRAWTIFQKEAKKICKTDLIRE